MKGVCDLPHEFFPAAFAVSRGIVCTAISPQTWSAGALQSGIVQITWELIIDIKAEQIKICSFDC